MEDALRSPRLSALALALVAALAVGLGACHRAAPDSPEFQQAFELYNKIYAAKLDDAYGDMRMQEVVSLLAKVDPASSRADEAKELKAKVDQGLAEFKKRQDTVAEDQKAAEAPAKWEGSPGGAVAPESSAPPPLPTGATAPTLGMPRDEFLKRFGDCFELRGLYQQGGKQGEAYGVREPCAKRFSSLGNSLVILLDNQVSRLLPMNEATTLDAGQPEAPAPPPPPKPEPPPPPPPAAPTSPLLPGMPRPDAPPPLPSDSP
jgi:hypothetical protein